MGKTEKTFNVSLITYYACIISRIVYFNNDNFLQKYSQIMNIEYLENALKKLKNTNMTTIFDNYITNQNMIKIGKEINYINYHNKIDKNIETKYIKYFIISTSNYSSVYIIGDKRTNTIFIGFRGTSSPKSSISYLKFSSILPHNICKKNKNRYLLGIYKIVTEIFYTINECINYIHKQFLKETHIKLITTGHSLGGGCSQIFSYLWAKKYPTSNIACITFGSPRVMNYYLIKNYNKLIKNKKIYFERIITEGDPFANLPLHNKILPKSLNYYHIDEQNNKLDIDHVLFCSNYKKTKKLVCGLKNKTKRIKFNKKNHGSYLSINYAKAAQGLTNFKKEIKRNNYLNTICRIIIGGNSEETKVVFFDLQHLKTPYEYNLYDNATRKIKKIVKTDYKYPDIYMNTQIFNLLIEKSNIIDKKTLNPLTTNNYVNVIELIDNSKPNKLLNCL